jgi:hypothetical protein
MRKENKEKMKEILKKEVKELNKIDTTPLTVLEQMKETKILTMEHIKCLFGKAKFEISTKLNLEQFKDIFDLDYEFDDIYELYDTIRELLYDNIYEQLKYDLRYNFVSEFITYEIAINGIKLNLEDKRHE